MYTKPGKSRFRLKNIVGTCDFHEIFGKVSKEIIILIYLPNYKYVSCQIFLSKKKQTKQNKKSWSFTNPSPLRKTLTTHSTHTAPQISIHFCEKMRYGLSIDYI